MDREIEWTTTQSSSRRYWVLAVVIALVLLFVAGWFSGRETAATHDWQTVRSGDLKPVIIGSGRFISTRQRLVTANENATVSELMRRPAERVDAGDGVLRLENPALSQELVDAVRQLDDADDELSAQRARARLEAIESQSALADAKHSLVLAEADLEANRVLLAKGLVSRLQFDKVEAAAALARSRVDSSQRTREAKQALMRVQIAQAESRLQQRRDLVARLEQRIENLSVKAPEAGIVKQIAVDLGNAVQPGSALFTIGPEMPDRASLQFPQGYLDQLHPDMTVNLAFNDKAATSRVVSVNSDLSNGYVEVEVEPVSDWQGAGIGMAVRAAAESRMIGNARYISTPPGLRKVDGELFVLRERDGQTRQLALSDAFAVDGYLVFPTQIQRGDRVAILHIGNDQ